VGHPLLTCLCNSRIVQPAHAGAAPSWPLLLLWGGLLALVAAGVVVWLVRRRRRRSEARIRVDERWASMGAFGGGPEPGVDDNATRDTAPEVSSAS